MAEIIKVCEQKVDAMRFIGKKYSDDDRVDGNFGSHWGQWHLNGWFDAIKKKIDKHIREIYEDGDAYIGLMHGGHDKPFEYWIGIFMPDGTDVPEGFNYIDFPAGKLGVCWVQGKEDEVFMHEGQCGERLEKEGFDVNTDWCFERYVCPRFTAPDENGKIILDICFYIK